MVTERRESKCRVCGQKVIMRNGMTEYAEGIERDIAITDAVGVVMSFHERIAGAFGTTLIDSIVDAVAGLSSSSRRRRRKAQ